MIRLIFLGLVLAAGFWLGGEWQKSMAIRACLDAGGGIDPRGFCVGVPGNG